MRQMFILTGPQQDARLALAKLIAKKNTVTLCSDGNDEERLCDAISVMGSNRSIIIDIHSNEECKTYLDLAAEYEYTTWLISLPGNADIEPGVYDKRGLACSYDYVGEWFGLYPSFIKQYLYDRKHKRVGMLVGIRDNGKVRIGWSQCNIKRDKFDKNLAQTIAWGRAEDGMRFNDMPYLVRQNLEAFEGRCKRYFRTEEVHLYRTLP